jgi:lipid-A-disaccharide synthase
MPFIMKDRPNIMIIAGEVSGDMHAAGVVRSLTERYAGARFFGVGGDLMKEAGVEIMYHVDDMAVVGLAEVVRRYGFLKKVFKHMLAEVRERRPEAVILVDYPGFNLRFAAKVKPLGIKVIYYVCPQVWAWNRSRIPRMARILDRLITIFPFEVDCFEGTGLKVNFAGHPLVDEAREALAEEPVELPWKGMPKVALLPGSRTHEIASMLPVMWSAAAILEETHPGIGFIVATPSEKQASVVRNVMSGLSSGPSMYEVTVGQTRQVLRQAEAAMVVSGTATIEASLMRCPMIIAYKVASLTYFLFKLLIRIPFIGMVNIVAGKEICPEMVQGKATPQALADSIVPFLHDGQPRRTMIEALKSVNSSLGSGDAARTTAGFIAEELNSEPD